MLVPEKMRWATTTRCIERSPTVLAEWNELKETFAKFQAERGNETSDDMGSNDMTSKAERKRKSDASPARCVSHKGKTFVVYHKVTVFLLV